MLFKAHKVLPFHCVLKSLFIRSSFPAASLRSGKTSSGLPGTNKTNGTLSQIFGGVNLGIRNG